jgi:hypothetical protein
LYKVKNLFYNESLVQRKNNLEVQLKSIYVITIIALLAGVALVGCGQAAATADNGPMQTAIAGTLVVMQTQLAKANAATAASVPTLAATPAPTATLAPTPAPTTAAENTPVVLPTSLPSNPNPSGPSYRVGGVADITIPDGTFINAKDSFTKTWTITNVGTGTWQADFKLVPVDDNPFQAPAYVYLGRVLSPGQSMNISVKLIAPEVPNTYTGHFMLETSDGVKFGIGPDFNQPFWVKITSH